MAHVTSVTARDDGSAALRNFRGGWQVMRQGFRERPVLLAVAVAGSAVYGVVTVLIARVIGHLVADVVTPAVQARHLGNDQLWTIIWQLGLAVLINVVGVLLRRIAAGFAYNGLNATYRERVTSQYLRLPLAWHHRHPSGELLSNANADVELTWSIFQPLPMAIGVIVMLVVGLVEMFRVDVWLTLIGLLVFPALFVANLSFQSRMSPHAVRTQQLRAEVSEVAHESVEAGLLVKAMGREDQETERFAERTYALRQSAIELGRVRGTFDPIIEALPTLGTLAVLAVGTAQVAAGRITPAEVVQVAYLFSVLAFPVRSFGWVLGGLAQSVVGWTRISNVLRERGAMAYGDQVLGGSAPISLGVQRVSFAYEIGGHADLGAQANLAPADVEVSPVLHDVSFSVEPGRTTALVGPTGSGKSTLAQLVLRLVDPQSGAIRYNGVDLRDFAAGAVAECAVLVTQEAFLFDDNVAGNITLGADFSEAQIRDALSAAQATGFVDALPDGMHTRVGERGASLSGGQRQRIALARAIIRQPRLLVLDDATSAVDPAVETQILHAIGQRSTPATVLVIAYRMSTIALADQIVFMDEGRVIDQGTHDDLLIRCPGYANLVTAYTREAAERNAIHAAEELS